MARLASGACTRCSARSTTATPWATRPSPSVAISAARGFASEIFAGRVDEALGLEARPLREWAGEDGPGHRLPLPLLAGQPGRPDRALRRGAARRRLPQRHPGAVLRRLVGRVGAARRAGRSRAPGARAPGRARPRQEHVQPGGTSRRPGSPPARVLPFVHDPGRRNAPSPVFERLYSDGRTHVLAVGRLAPNKRVEDLLRAFALLQRGPLPRSRLLLVGDDGLRAYADALLALARALRLRDVVFCGHVDEDELALRLRPRRRARLALRARGLRRPPRGGDARRRAGRGLRRGGDGGDDGRRGHPPRREAPGARGRRDRGAWWAIPPCARPCSRGRSGWRRGSARQTSAPWSPRPWRLVLEGTS